MFAELLKIITDYKEVLDIIMDFPSSDREFFKQLAREEVRAKWKSSTPVTAEDTSDDEDDDLEIEAYRISESDLAEILQNILGDDED